jgi:hypothetical protein
MKPAALALRGIAALAIALPALLVPGAMPAVQGGAVCAAADGASHVAVVVEHADGRSISRCVTFTGAGITGEQALDASVIQRQYYDYGGSLGKAVCQVDGEPVTPSGGWTRNNCLGYPYWSTWTARSGGGWSGATHGVSNTNYADGDAEGLRYGDGTGPPPPALGVCPRAASPAPPPASPQPRPPASAPPQQLPAPAAAAGAPATPSPTSEPSPSTSLPSSPSPEASPTPELPAPANGRISLSRPSTGWIATAVAAVVLIGMLAVQVLAGRRGA